ncbi:ABC transporter ATP-binding protein [Clostridium sp. DJ247]|uniref:ABC transporter ATP-binding protein n=1 Tax=Clostridium sp. DJ247 TaxID=2726188 RepID=UPI00162A8093|nr:ABC transporter ATP-binding protein [Clostridium sp. DJ247]MBC2579442.1 ABC transporter ATP-binding protein [Clostridium sp. DJ247]
MSYISIKQINKDFRGIKALNDLNLDIEKGEFITLLGPSGCGKSTLLRIIAGLETSSSGDIFINNKNIIDIPVNKRNIGMVFQSYSLFPNMTTEENVAFGLKLKRLPKPNINAKVHEILSIVGLAGREKHYPHQLSGGQQQRVALARALVVNPDVLLLDEPLSALDAKIRISLRNLIKDIQQKLKITTIFVTHDQEEALSLSDRIFVMEKGEVVQQGSPEEIYQKPKTQFVASFIGTYNFFSSSFLNEPEDNKQILVRPEHINIIPDKNINLYKNALHGIIHNVYFLGNIIRLNILVNDTIVIVDTLNKDASHYLKGNKLSFYIEKDKYIQLT